VTILPLLTAAACGPPLLALARRRDHAITLLILGLCAAAVGAAGLLSMQHDWKAGWLLIAVLPGLGLLAAVTPTTWGGPALLDWLRRHPRLRGVAVMGLASVVMVGGAEWTIYLLAKGGVIRLLDPVRTVLPAGTEDWRRAAVIGDHTREPDPVLFWRPRPTSPYNAQRLQGPLAAVPKPAGTWRILCYGDSNTEGHTGDGGWPRRLGEVMRARGFAVGGEPRAVEVLNAGVTGYSSYQGLMRCREQVAVYQPDLILVSFGWNDAPLAIGKPDKEFAIPSGWVVRAQRFLLRFRSFRLVCALLRDDAPPPPDVGPRVSVADYVANLESFAGLAAAHGAEVVLLTRPHRAPVAAQAAAPGWRATVPAYNDALRAYAARAGVAMVDVQRAFDGRGDLFADECHFTQDGAARMADLLYDHLRRLPRWR